MKEVIENTLDKRAIMTKRLNAQRKDRGITFLLDKFEKEDYIFRDFNLEDTWQRTKETYFIESLLLCCEIEPISIYVGKEKTILIDGFRRVRAIQKFFSNEVTLTKGGLQKLHFLADKKIEDLPKDYQKFLKENCKIKVIEYKAVGEKEFSNLEEEYIEKEIYRRYNTGLRLKPFEIQKAQFDRDILSQKLKIFIHTNEDIKRKLREIGILNEKEIEANYEKAMVEIRRLITSTYCPIDVYAKLKGDNRIATEGYIPYVSMQDAESVIDIFEKTITFLHAIIQNKAYQTYEDLHTKRYLQGSYWLYSTIIKDNLMKIEDFKVELYIDYCHHNNSVENFFNSKTGNTGKNYKEKMIFISDFLKKFYSISMENYFKEEKKRRKREYHI